MAASTKKSDFEPLASLSESERKQVLAVMQRAKEFDMKEETKLKNWQPLEGQLTKFTNVMKGWQPRWFLLDPDSGMLEYFEKEEHKKHRPRGSIHLASAVISPSEEDSQTFSVSAANAEVYKLRATSTRERQQWVDRLRQTAEHHSNLANQQSLPAELQRGVRSQSVSSGGLVTPTSQKPRLSTSENIAPPRLAPPSHRAPVAHPHLIDPFLEVKEYMMEAEDYSHGLTEKINTLPYSGEPICGLDSDMLLLKATSAATLQCLGQCLTMLQQRQKQMRKEAYGITAGGQSSVSASLDMAPRRDSRTKSLAESVHSPVGSFTSACDLPFLLPETNPVVVVDHDEEEEDVAEYKDTDLEGVEEHKSIILHLLSQLKLGMDLTKVVLPTFILERRSLLELFADCMAHPDVFLRITCLSSPEERMMAVLEWYLTSFHAGRQGSIAKKPYNPIIGETFHCSWRIPPEQIGETSGDGGEPYLLSYTAEQVSHHPPVSAFYFECPKKRVCVNASIWTKSKFMGMSIGVVMVGKVVLKLLDFDEEYVFSLPSAYARSILTTPWVEMGDRINMTCPQTNFSAGIIFHTKPFYGGRLHRVSAEVKNGNTGNITCKVQGEWNSSFEFTYTNGNTKTVNVEDNKVWRKRVRPVQKQGDFESRKLWQHVTSALKVGDINTATEHKKFLEERQREGERHRKDTNTAFPTKFFKKVGDAWLYKDML
ncbi:oxysterol-binding protein-related protein 11-like isoform X2 [Mya arenaria]|uniref:oxysterol-binding protein-related protein 11-like isoform X2 n=1 Tax=Mya arenaria TaxID=6604 RepID=UPI0022E87A24|nr:oxysterol-binding protein-related protein 11-like isoform X2 [Mya arenaria]